MFKRATTMEPERKTFGAPKDVMDLPDLIEVQLDSYRWFIEKGIRELFDEINPIRDFIGRDLELWFDKYYLDEPKFDEATSRAKNVTYEAPLRVKTILRNKRGGDIKETEIYLGDLPLMTPRGTYIINGVERVIVSQLVRSAGAFFTAEANRGRRYYGAKIIPNRGAWLEFETDTKNVMWVKIDRKRKVPVTALLRAFGYDTDEQILELFKDVDSHPLNKYVEATIAKDVSKNEEEGLKEVYRRIRPGDLATVDNARQLIHSMFFNFDRYDLGTVGRYKFNLRFDKAVTPDVIEPKENRILTKEDLVLIIREIVRLNMDGQ